MSKRQFYDEIYLRETLILDRCISGGKKRDGRLQTFVVRRIASQRSRKHGCMHRRGSRLASIRGL